MAAKMRLICESDQGCPAATDWHDGQIRCGAQNHVKCRAIAASFVIPGRDPCDKIDASIKFCARRASFDVQLHIRESISPGDVMAPWIPGLRLTAHPGKTRKELVRRMGGANGSRECAPDDELRDTQRTHTRLMGFASAQPILRASATRCGGVCLSSVLQDRCGDL